MAGDVDDPADALRRLRESVLAYEALCRKCYGRHDPAADYKDLFRRMTAARLEMFRAARATAE